MNQLLLERNSCTHEEARNVSMAMVSNYEKTIAIYVNQLLSYNLKDGQGTNGRYLTEEDVEAHCSTYLHDIYRGLLPGRSNDTMIFEEHVSFIWSYYVFLVVDNRYFKYCPSWVWINERLIRFPSRSRAGRKISESSKEVCHLLTTLCYGVLGVIDRFELTIDAAKPTLHTLIAFAGWIEVIYYAEEHRDFDRFKSDLRQWISVKEIAETALRDEGVFQSNVRWTDCFQWLNKMRGLNGRRSGKEIRKALFSEIMMRQPLRTAGVQQREQQREEGEEQREEQREEQLEEGISAP